MNQGKTTLLMVTNTTIEEAYDLSNMLFFFLNLSGFPLQIVLFVVAVN